jgi:hypothetical protein
MRTLSLRTSKVDLLPPSLLLREAIWDWCGNQAAAGRALLDQNPGPEPLLKGGPALQLEIESALP